MNCQGRVAIITGAAGNGMGRSIALTLARALHTEWQSVDQETTLEIEKGAGVRLGVRRDQRDDAQG
jgi:NAD(P)-dependent dehydrogenase (short-subunit alcohol dehydrogenase family)